MKSLETYRRKRNFSRTNEPHGSQGPARARPRASAREPQALGYVIQKHAARRLHYDFRLELDGVLLSWAVPKGPSLDPAVKRLAQETEPHPLEYGGFEGIIPKGEYGGGTVMVWDRGSWEPVGDARAGYAKGHLEFTLKGDKLSGRWHLVKTKGLAGARGEAEKKSWLLFKARDDAAAVGHGEIVVLAPDSALTGRNLEQIAANDASAAMPAIRDDKPSRKVELETAERSAYPLTNPDKVMYPELGLTKRQVLEYYELVAERMLPHVANRPLTLVRCPNGRDKPCFFQKHPGAVKMPGLRSIAIREKEGKAPYSVIDDAEGLFALVQLGALEIHTWGSRADDFERPDLLVFDLDPDPALPFQAVIRGALRLRELFAQAKLESFVKTTGGKGLHVCIPFEPDLSWDQIKSFAESVALALAAESPRDYLATQSKSKRKGRIFIDYLRNGRGATFIAPYSTRAREGAPIAAPVEWEELTPRFVPARFSVRNIAERLRERREDPFARMATLRQRLRPEIA